MTVQREEESVRNASDVTKARRTSDRRVLIGNYYRQPVAGLNVLSNIITNTADFESCSLCPRPHPTTSRTMP